MPAPVSQSVDPAVTTAITKAIKDGMKDAKIVNMTSPVEAANQSSQSAAAGDQSSG